MRMGEWMSTGRVALDGLIVMTSKKYLKPCKTSKMKHLVVSSCKTVNLRCLKGLPRGTHLFCVSRTLLKNNCPMTS